MVDVIFNLEIMQFVENLSEKLPFVTHSILEILTNIGVIYASIGIIHYYCIDAPFYVREQLQNLKGRLANSTFEKIKRDVEDKLKGKYRFSSYGDLLSLSCSSHQNLEKLNKFRKYYSSPNTSLEILACVYGILKINQNLEYRTETIIHEIGKNRKYLVTSNENLDRFVKDMKKYYGSNSNKENGYTLEELLDILVTNNCFRNVIK